ncbi:MAG: hypothetical protein UV58_C0010G0018 [Candidatus Wolfebacteria bacterium GW2011_GWC1_43_10]|uniref:Endonuclease NucS C-terminal domain-containing protein n=1 Tax=Candidatus Wolfebacteria bacterium GW2011_GWC1_43_10 TaxID=1619011 RepID=A0A0G1F683_9BACT|nr:MAG: hypothetical protein UV58_C0010G0018 [Candidatus Wolfebacteria bacterium GW2011_GWC1_43_10]
MISQQRIKEWIDLYLKYIEDITPEAHVRDEEGYKFKSVDTFQQCFNADASNLAENLDEAIERNNLVAGSMYFPKRVLTILASEYEEEIRDILKNLFNTEKDVSQRVNETENDFNCLVDKRNKEQDEKWEHSFIGLRFLSLLLGFRYPNKYNAIKPREWNMFCKFIDEDFRIPQGTSSGERYKILEPYIDALRAEIRQISEIQKLKEQLTRGLNFVDEEFRWMAQDVIYVTACILASQRGAEKSEQKSTLVSEKPIGVSEDIETDDEGSPAQQYPTSEGFIDLLAKDTDDNFVVIELKKGRSNQQVVGQILSYVGWVKNNLAEKDQKVRGIIVTADGNQALLDAVSTVSDFISVKYYCMKFNFTNPE